MHRTIWINEDNAHFYIGHPPEDMTREGVEAVVDKWCTGTGVAAVSWNVNVQRALFASRVWEPLYAGYEPDGPDDQACLRWLAPEQRALRMNSHGRQWVHNLWLLGNRGVDHPQVVVDRCRWHGVEGWLSVRMNDCHHNDSPEAFWHSSLWREGPELHRAAYRDEGWFETAFDYSQDRVVEHHLALIRELFDRYDFDGIEIDWLRWVRHFRPGAEEAGAARLTDLMRRVRELACEASRRRGHPVRVAARLPASLEACPSHGYDIASWAGEELLDVAILGVFLSQTFFDFRVDLWRRFWGPGVRLLAQCDSSMQAVPEDGERSGVLDYRLLKGAATAALSRGADGVYLFNECYRESPGDGLTGFFPDVFETITRGVAELGMLHDSPRRAAVSHPQIRALGEATGGVFPAPLTREEGMYDFNRFRETITLRIPIGPLPGGLPVFVILGFRGASCETLPALHVWLNAYPLGVPLIEEPDAFLDPIGRRQRGLPANVERAALWEVAPPALQAGDNVLEVLAPQPIAGELVWAEIWIGPRRA